ncbi:CLUMA_CG007895, isoform A [Clunio marinus]|uniref:CLUMA_CG007895, isoform A n=1 Tax=Clunio marinus TaxID=568069 RepID=A0A1J1I3P9_9DIPT|nr:CLUMA_CG007895, isoform A [Clunio marinus]
MKFDALLVIVLTCLVSQSSYIFASNFQNTRSSQMSYTPSQQFLGNLINDVNKESDQKAVEGGRRFFGNFAQSLMNLGSSLMEESEKEDMMPIDAITKAISESIDAISKDFEEQINK